MVLVAEEAAAMLLGLARIAVLLPELGMLLLPRYRCAAGPQLIVLSRLFRCVGTGTILASMICAPRAM
jgi:hypothetical protein